MFGQDYLLRNLCVKGEVSNCKYHTSGHIYFTLKDENSALTCAMFKGKREKGLTFRLEDGMKVNVTGSVQVYEKSGSYSLYANRIEPDGLGALHMRYEQLKKELQERGMFDDVYKQPIPKYIRTLGVVTAPTGAAIHDIISVAQRRNPHVRILLYPAIVQGAEAAPSIVRGIRRLSGEDVDVMIVGRGGGSIEDLWAFNEPEVAEAVFNCPIPVISAVGHEVDYTITDFVADRRAPTPSAAAELAVFEYERFVRDLEDYRESLYNAMEDCMEERRQELADMEMKLRLLSPGMRIRAYKDRYIRCRDRLNAAMLQMTAQGKRRTELDAERLRHSARERIIKDRHRLDLDIERLKGLSPLDRISSGYAYVADENGKTIRSVSDVSEGSLVEITVRDGRINAEVKELENVDIG